MSRTLALATLALATSSLAACTPTTDEPTRPLERPSPDIPRNSAPPLPAAAPTSAEPPAPPSAAAPVVAPSPPAPPPADVPAPSASAPTADRPDLVPACDRRPKLTCTRTGDLDGDGQIDTVALVRPKDGKKIGLLITWGRGGTAVLGAGEKGQTWREQVDESASTVPIPTDLGFLERWEVWPADGPAGKRRGFTDPKWRRRHRVPGVRGDGLLVDGGDSAAVAYWDGARWRLYYLGY